VGHGEVILVVDDEASVCELTKTILQTYGYRILTAADGVEAVALLAQGTAAVDAVVLDMSMPVMDGVQTLGALRKINPRVPVILSSGTRPEEGALERLGNPSFLSKPFTSKMLLEAVHKAVASRQA
jgi:CheY-like chemotaxis protein